MIEYTAAAGNEYQLIYVMIIYQFVVSIRPQEKIFIFLILTFTFSCCPEVNLKLYNYSQYM